MIFARTGSDPRGRHAAAPAEVSAAAFVVAVGRRAVRIGATAVLLLLFTGFIAGRLVLHLGMSPVLTGSMRPTFAPGDAVVTRMVATSQLRPGQIALIVPPGETAPYAHRLQTVTSTAKGITVTTKGDANPQPDAWHTLLTEPQVPVVVTHVPKLGYALNAVHDPRWRSALLAALGLLITFLATRTVLAASPKKPRVAHDAWS